MRQIIAFLMLGLCLIPLTFSQAFAQTNANHELSEGYRYLNALRRQVKMVPFRTSRILQQAAQGHANYLTAHRITGHDQQRGRQGFTGRKPVNRAHRAGYPHSSISENVSGGQKNARDSVDGLMSAIYHRFGFLAFDKDEVGFGLNLRKDLERFTFNMGFQGMTELCLKPPRQAIISGPGRYYQPCRNQGLKIVSSYYENLAKSVMRRNPPLVIWPENGNLDVPPAFFEETPDPLPDYGVSANPLSVHFNPAFVKQAIIRSFKVFHHDGPIAGGRYSPNRMRELKNTRLMTKSSDPNHKLSALQFALFPLEPFEWNQYYIGEAVFVVDGREQTLRWYFKTRDPGAPLYRLEGKGETVPVIPNKDYVVYLPPVDRKPRFNSSQWSMSKGVRVLRTALDHNTSRIRIIGDLCTSVNFSLRGGKFSLRLAAMDNIGAQHPPQQLYATCPEFGSDYNVSGNNEVFPVQSGKPYVLFFKPTSRYPKVGGISYRATSSQIQVKFLGNTRNSLKMAVTGPICSELHVFMKDGRRFMLRLSKLDNARGGKHPPQALYATCPEFAADYRMAGRNELIAIIPGQAYNLYFPPSSAHPQIPGISWSYETGVRFQLARSGNHAMTIQASGPRCGRVLVTLKDGRKFRVQLSAKDAKGTSGMQADRVPGC